MHLLSFAAPLWLFGLLLVPAIRWLHGRGRNMRSIAVSSSVLWQKAVVSSPAAGKLRPPDPVWRRRALLCALLFVALAGPLVAERQTRVTVWVDDSLSMLTRETDATRVVEGLAQVRSALPDRHVEVEVRTLSDPWNSLGSPTDATAAAIARVAGHKRPAVPPEALLRQDAQQWLLTDGAHADLLEWPGGKVPDRTFHIGRVTRNVGLERVSARRRLDDPDRYDLLLKVTNGGTAAESRSVLFETSEGELARSSERLDPGASLMVHATVHDADEVRVRLEPNDALAADDDLVLDVRALRRRRVAVDAKCPAMLVAAVRAHPALSIAEQKSSDVAAELDCGTHAGGYQRATIRIIADSLPRRVGAPLQWSSAVPESSRVGVNPEALELAGRLTHRTTDAVWLAAGGEALIVGRAGTPPVVETIVDFNSASSARGPDLPLLVNFMFERALGDELLNGIVSVDRGRDSAKVVPAQSGSTSGTQAISTARSRSLAQSFLVAALLVLVWEVTALGRRMLRSRLNETSPVSA